MNSVNYGWWQTYIYNYIDADHIVFSNETGGANRARLVSALITGTLITGDDYSKKGPWCARAKGLLQNKEVLAIAKNGIAFRPVDDNSRDTANAVFQRVIKGCLYVAVFNFTDKVKDYKIDFSRLGLSPLQRYQVTEIFTNGKAEVRGSLNLTLQGSDAAIYKFKLYPP